MSAQQYSPFLSPLGKAPSVLPAQTDVEGSSSPNTSGSHSGTNLYSAFSRTRWEAVKDRI